MTLLDNVRDSIESLSEKEFRNYFMIAVSIVIIGTGFIIYRYYANIHRLNNRLAILNEQREEIKQLLERYELVQQQKQGVDALLAQDTNFKIAGYFGDVLTQLALTNNKISEPELSQDELENGYTEITLSASLQNMNMKTITQLLDTLEKKQRIYTKALELSRPSQAASITINIIIATLEPQQKPAATTE